MQRTNTILMPQNQNHTPSVSESYLSFTNTMNKSIICPEQLRIQRSTLTKSKKEMTKEELKQYNLYQKQKQNESIIFRAHVLMRILMNNFNYTFVIGKRFRKSRVGHDYYPILQMYDERGNILFDFDSMNKQSLQRKVQYCQVYIIELMIQILESKGYNFKKVQTKQAVKMKGEYKPITLSKVLSFSWNISHCLNCLNDEERTQFINQMNQMKNSTNNSTNITINGILNDQNNSVKMNNQNELKFDMNEEIHFDMKVVEEVIGKEWQILLENNFENQPRKLEKILCGNLDLINAIFPTITTKGNPFESTVMIIDKYNGRIEIVKNQLLNEMNRMMENSISSNCLTTMNSIGNINSSNGSNSFSETFEKLEQLEHMNNLQITPTVICQPQQQGINEIQQTNQMNGINEQEIEMNEISAIPYVRKSDTSDMFDSFNFNDYNNYNGFTTMNNDDIYVEIGLDGFTNCQQYY